MRGRIRERRSLERSMRGLRRDRRSCSGNAPLGERTARGTLRSGNAPLGERTQRLSLVIAVIVLAKAREHAAGTIVSHPSSGEKHGLWHRDIELGRPPRDGIGQTNAS